MEQLVIVSEGPLTASTPAAALSWILQRINSADANVPLTRTPASEQPEISQSTIRKVPASTSRAAVPPPLRRIVQFDTTGVAPDGKPSTPPSWTVDATPELET